MKFSTVIALALAGVASAQTAATQTQAAAPGSIVCDALYIVQECLALETAERNKCKAQDYECLCDTASRQDRCWDNCPKNTNERFQYSADKSAWCQAWSQSPEYKTVAASRSSYYATATTSSSASSTPSSSTTSSPKESSTDSATGGAGAKAVNGAAVVLAAAVAALF